MSKVREETYKEEELRRTLDEINRDARGGYREKRSRDVKGTDRGSEERRRKDRPDDAKSKRKVEEERKPRDEDEERRRHRDDKDDRRRSKVDGDGDRRRQKEDDEGRRRRKEDGDDRRRSKEDGDDRRRRKEDGDDRRRRKDDDDDRRRRKEDDDRRRRKGDDDDRRRRKEDGEDRRRHKEDDDDRRRRKEDGDDRRRRKEDGDDRRRRKEDDEKRRHRDEKEDEKHDRRRHKDREETEEEREKRKKEERRKRREEEGGDERRRRKEETEEEREKRKKEERRKRKEEEEERRKREEEEKRKREEMERKAAAEEKEDEDDYNDYEDDFENYDDDFENEDSSSGTVNEKNKEMADILRAMSAENDRLSHNKNKRRDSHSSSTSGEVIPAARSSQSGQQKYFINFVSARTRQVDAAVSNRTRQRSRELLRLIHLDCTTHDMFEMGELEAYQLYMRSCGRIAANQVACQTNDDAMDREVQCEPIERRTLWTLHPPEELNAVGFSSSGAKEAEEKRRGSMGGFRGLQDQLAEEEANRSRESEARQILQSASLRQSMLVMLRLLEEETRPMIAAPPSGCSQLSNGYSALSCPPELRHLPCRFVAFAPSQTNLLVTLHSHGQRAKDRDVGYALVWNVTTPREPQEVLEAPARATCAAFSPVAANLVFLGLVDGCLAAWDLREAAAWHPTDAKGRRRRAPTYSTSAVNIDVAANHRSPIVDLVAIASGPAAFQLASLDASGSVLLWVTTQLPVGDMAGSEADLGLRPGGKVRLSRTAELHKPIGDFHARAFAPSFESGAFLIGSELGDIHHVGRRGARLFPRLFRPVAAASAVASLDVSPFREPFFLAGYADGAVRVFHYHHARPLLEFVEFGAVAGIVQVRWSRSRPGVFFALDGAGGLATWDLTRDDLRPLSRESPGGREDRKVVQMALSCDYSATRQGNRGQRPQVAFLFGSGGSDFLEVHEMTEALCVGDLDETFRVSNLLNSFI